MLPSHYPAPCRKERAVRRGDRADRREGRVVVVAQQHERNRLEQRQRANGGGPVERGQDGADAANRMRDHVRRPPDQLERGAEHARVVLEREPPDVLASVTEERIGHDRPVRTAADEVVGEHPARAREVLVQALPLAGAAGRSVHEHERCAAAFGQIVNPSAIDVERFHVAS
ncbi:MAG TPA: hypothetical protein VF203_11740 [Burkholderiales bacterium]